MISILSDLQTTIINFSSQINEDMSKEEVLTALDDFIDDLQYELRRLDDALA